MYPAPFEYHTPASVQEAVALLARYQDEAKLLAGGHSLLPIMKLRFAQPKHLIDLRRIPGMTGISDWQDGIAIGATTTHHEIEDSEVIRRALPVLAEAAALIGDPLVRNRGTIGGSLAHADPSADWLACLMALGAEAVIASAGGRRRALLSTFVRGAMETELAPGELLTAVRIPRFAREARFGFHKICRKTGEFAEAMAAVVAVPPYGYLAAVVSPANGRPQLMESRNVDWPKAAITLDEAKAILKAADKLRQHADDDGYARTLHAVALKRACDEACAA